MFIAWTYLVTNCSQIQPLLKICSRTKILIQKLEFCHLYFKVGLEIVSFSYPYPMQYTEMCLLKSCQIAMDVCQYFLYGNWKNRRRHRHNWNSSYKISILAQWVEFFYENVFIFLISSIYSPNIINLSGWIFWDDELVYLKEFIRFENFSMTLLFTMIFI